MHRLPLIESSEARAEAEIPSTLAEGPQRLTPWSHAVYGWKMASGIVSSRVAGRHRPLMVNIEPTHRCNLDCDYCDKVDPRSPQMETEKALVLIDELAALGTLSVCFDGGEPLVHKGIEQFVRRAKRHGMRVSMSSNGILVKRKRRVLDYVDVIKFSLDGPRDIHDRGRGEGSFEGALEGARIARDAGCSVALRMTLASHNVPYFRDVIATAKELGVTCLFQPAIGDIMDNTATPAAHSAEVEAYREAIDELMKLKAGGEPIGNMNVCLEHLRNWPDPTPSGACSAGRIEVAIGPNGGMYPCGRTGRHAEAPNVFAIGAARAFEQVMRPTDCQNCWCTLTLAGCFLYGGNLGLLRG